MHSFLFVSTTKAECVPVLYTSPSAVGSGSCLSGTPAKPHFPSVPSPRLWSLSVSFLLLMGKVLVVVEGGGGGHCLNPGAWMFALCGFCPGAQALSNSQTCIWGTDENGWTREKKLCEGNATTCDLSFVKLLLDYLCPLLFFLHAAFLFLSQNIYIYIFGCCSYQRRWWVFYNPEL